MVFGLVGCLGFLVQQQVSNPTSVQQAISSGVFEGKVLKPVSLKYLTYLPEDYNESRKRFPLLLFLHGSGERGADLEKVLVHGPLKLAAAGQKFPFIIVAPQCPANRSWDADELVGLLNDLEKKFRVDRSREYVSGLSMGGYGTWALLAAQPKRFAAAIPICGGGDPNKAAQFANVPLWVVHGDQDQAVPFQQSVNMVTALEAAGGTPIFTKVIGGGHDVWTDFYSNKDVYEWLLKHKR